MCRRGVVDAIRFDVILEVINPVLDLRQDFAPEDRGGVFQNLIKSLFERLDAIALRQRFNPAAAEPRGALLGVEIAFEMLR